ncbi:MAG: hypothetical protein M1834_003660 [Cirrosporium novae-zelandiae]|nr:MAG: hypothetical protein M1834_003660 [Cirrosporium novae-zelandiae]
MTVQDVVTDPFLQKVLGSTHSAREQCLSLLNYLESHPTTSTEPASKEIQLEFSKQQKLLFASLAQLKGLNRNAIFAVRQTKQSTAQARQEIDRLHLQLQNLYYEQKHLLGEIAACESYDHKYTKLPLISEEQFMELHPEHTDDDDHTLMMARIEHEHVEREALERQRQDLLKRKQRLIAENKKRKDDLANLDNDLEKFIDAAKPIQKTFEKEY